MSPFLPVNVLFPAFLDNTTSIPLAIDNVVSVNANAFNTLRQAIIAIEGELGVKPSGIYGTVKSRLNTYDTLFNIQGDPTNSVTLGPAQDGYILTWDGYAFIPSPALSGSFSAGGDLDGSDTNQTVIGIQGVSVSSSAPTTGQVLTAISGTSANWQTINLTSNNSITGVLPSANQAPQTMGDDVSGTTATSKVIALQGNSVAAQTLDSNNDGYVLAWDNSDAYWKATKLDAGLELFSGGTPVETTNNLGVDGYSIVLNTVSGVPTLSAISSSFGITYPVPPVATDFTAFGAISAVQSSNYIIAKTVEDGVNGGRELLLPLPNGVSGSGPFVAVMVAACQFNYNTSYPGFALVITNGDTGGSSAELWNGVYMNNNEPCVGVWEATLQSSSRGTVYVGDNSYYYTWPMQQLHFRTINDGVNIIFQYSNMGGYNWRTSYYNTIANLGLGTITNYGISMGAYVGTGWGAAVITALNMAVQPQLTISSISSASSLYVVQTTTPHGLSIGDDVSITGVPGGSAANAVYTGGAVNGITSTTTFTVNAGSSITTQTSGFVTILSQ